MILTICYRDDCFDTTLVHLTERFNGKDVYLVGTTNQSTMLAQRTQKLIEEIKPDTVLVQTSAEWWDNAKMLGFVDSQAEMEKYNGELDRFSNHKAFDFYTNNRKWLALFRLWSQNFLFRYHFGMNTQQFEFTRPGLEVKLACESAEKVGARVGFMGPELCQKTWQRLLHETRFNIPEYMLKRVQYQGTKWVHEILSNRQKIQLAGPAAFSEKCLDANHMNWMIQCSDIFFPKMKKILVDERDEDLFCNIDKCDGEKIVVVVNQWHMEGIEHHWAHRYGQVPRSVQFPDGINPIGDMDLREGLFQRLYNNLHREIASANSKAGTPSTYADWIIGYHRESNFQYEHRDM